MIAFLGSTADGISQLEVADVFLMWGQLMGAQLGLTLL